MDSIFYEASLFYVVRDHNWEVQIWKTQKGWAMHTLVRGVRLASLYLI